jgi:hypothetical protein
MMISVYSKHPKNVMTALEAVSQQDFLKCFQQWQRLCTMCIAAQGDHIKGDPFQ